MVYLMMTHPLRVAGNLPIESLVARQLPTNLHLHCMLHVHTYDALSQCASSVEVILCHSSFIMSAVLLKLFSFWSPKPESKETHIV